MVATRRRGADSANLEINSGKSKGKDNTSDTVRSTISVSSSSDSDSDLDLDELVQKSCLKMRAKLKDGRPQPPTQSSSQTFVIDKTPGYKEPLTLPTDSDTDSDVDDVNYLTRPSSSSSQPKPISKNENYERKSDLDLASSIHCNIDVDNIYINVDTFHNPTSKTEQLQVLEKTKELEVMKKSVIGSDFEKKDCIPPYEESLHQMKKQKRKLREQSKGKNWFNMSAPEMTEEKKNSLQVLQMRRALDPKRFYKGNDIKALPKFFQFGTVVDNPVDFYHSRIPKKQRKATLVDELLADAELRKYNKRKYAEIQEAKQRARGPYRHMKRLKKKKR